MAWSSPRRIWLAAGALTAVAAVTALAWSGWLRGGEVQSGPTYTVRPRQFRVSHFESGEIRAAQADQVTAPRVHGDLKIVRLWPEGEHVEFGDLILQFDRAEAEKEVKDQAGELEQAKADLTQALAEQERRLSEMEAEVEQREAAVGLAQISLQKAQYASPVEREQMEIRLQQAERAFTQAKANLKARRIVNRVERANIELRITHRQRRYDRALDDYERLSVYATRPGIVVYEKIRKRGTDREDKVMEGDVVWGGTGLLSLPDLTEMQAYSQVGEMDVSQVEVGMPALIRLEAYPGPVFHGTVADIAPMASEKQDAVNVPIFEMVVSLAEQDERLYPGMSASVEVVLESLDDALFVPLSAVTQRDGKHYVRRLKGRSFADTEVVLGRDNGIDVLIQSGLEDGDQVALPQPPPL
ncbi:MAG: efflux RND transporter periplasmic adaptor subunit [Gemmatimonadota bacterium]